MKPLHTCTLEEVMEITETKSEGLSQAEAAERLAKNGKNALAEGKKRSLIAKFFDQMKDVMIIVLLVAALVSGVLAVVQKHYADLIDTGIILLIVILNAVIGLVQENKAEASMDALKNLNKPYAKVLRDGIIQKIKSEEIVTGDVVLLEAGDIVPADMRLFETASLKIEEAALTGESVPTEKADALVADPNAPLGDRTNMAYSTGVVAYGRGQGVVTATGMQTEVGKIAKMLQDDTKQQTPLQEQLAKTAKMLSILVLSIAVVIFAAALIRGLTAGGDAASIVTSSFMTAVAIAVAAIPEGLPAVVTIVLAIGVQRMSEKRAIVRNLPAVEALGCCEVICSDKTGTLTLNQMTVQELYTLQTGTYHAETKQDAAAADMLVQGMVLCNDTKRVEEKLIGDPTETALIAYADTLGKTEEILTYRRVGENPFDSIRKLMSTVNETPAGTVGHIKGAPDILIGRCTHILDENASVRPITEADKEKIAAANVALAHKALRVLGVAIKKEDVRPSTLEENMIFVGLVGMIDPPRPEAKDAVAVCRRAGMRTVMITGDHSETARAIATQIGILEEGALVITGAELDALSDEAFLKDIDRYRVFARVSPENKVRIVKGFQTAGYKVAMTGDGVNDAPSIKSADIGVGMGITGTDVSKGASDMVLADDNFATIVSAVEEGRKVYSNIKKAVQYLLSANIAEVLCLFIATVFLNVPFLTPVMILWVNLVTDSLPALALGMEKAESDIMSYPPRKSTQSLFAGKTGRDILLQGLMQTGLVMASFCIGQYLLFPNGGGEAMTMAFITLCLIQLLHAYNTRSQTHSLFEKNPFGNKMMNISFLVCLALLLFVLLIPGVGPTLFDTVPAGDLGGAGWGAAIGLSFGILPLVELQKIIERQVTRKKSAKKPEAGV